MGTVNVSTLARSATMETLAKLVNVIPPLVNVISLIETAVTIILVLWTLVLMAYAATRLWCARMMMTTCVLSPLARVEPVSPATLFVLMMTMMTALVTFALTEVASSEAEIALVLWVLLRKKKSLCLLLRFLNLLLIPRFLLLLKAFLLSKVVALVAMEAVVSLTVLKTLLLDHGVPE